eukprot:NODE_34_length_4758_cov_22.451996_g27_i0.p1 GENE.NODE_34_length_4758_cov_22.451996_g27_i0~~NODE_34_length_4758_cov_22.451996_g27_i0.p1  ORF type:complete len:1499 (-),score=303.88 NODE_34_length_4758_cov_22.451996_g27_i0:213-4709(-)
MSFWSIPSEQHMMISSNSFSVPQYNQLSSIYNSYQHISPSSSPTPPPPNNISLPHSRSFVPYNGHQTIYQASTANTWATPQQYQPPTTYSFNNFGPTTIQRTTVNTAPSSPSTHRYPVGTTPLHLVHRPTPKPASPKVSTTPRRNSLPSPRDIDGYKNENGVPNGNIVIPPIRSIIPNRSIESTPEIKTLPKPSPHSPNDLKVDVPVMSPKEHLPKPMSPHTPKPTTELSNEFQRMVSTQVQDLLDSLTVVQDEINQNISPDIQIKDTQQLATLEDQLWHISRDAASTTKRIEAALNCNRGRKVNEKVEMGNSGLDYHKMMTEGRVESDVEDHTTALSLTKAVEMRRKYVPDAEFVQDGRPILGHCRSDYLPPNFQEYVNDLESLHRIVSSGPCKSVAHSRLVLLDQNFRLHCLLNSELEQSLNWSDDTDFSSVAKVDNAILLETAPNGNLLRRFVSLKARTSGDTPAGKNGETLKDVFKRLGMDPTHVTLDSLNVKSNSGAFQRYTMVKQNCQSKDITKIFLSYEGADKGKNFASLLKEVSWLWGLSNHNGEIRVPVTWCCEDQWNTLSSWINDNELWSDNLSWTLSIVANSYVNHKSEGKVNNYKEWLDNMFDPLLKATQDKERHPYLNRLLEIVGSFSITNEGSTDLVGDRVAASTPSDQWTMNQNPPFAYANYYIWTKLVQLNQLRASLGLNTYSYRPACGMFTDPPNCLLSGYLLAQSVCPGLQLHDMPVLEYLYYMAQIGIVASPITSNQRHTRFSDNPMPYFFRRGLPVALCTWEPLHSHISNSPLDEEYAAAALNWKLSDTDLSEFARFSVLLSDFSHEQKAKWLGDRYYVQGSEGNNPTMSNIPDIRLAFRYSQLENEREWLKQICTSPTPRIASPRSHQPLGKHQASEYVQIQLNYVSEEEPDSLRKQAAALISKAIKLREIYFKNEENVDYNPDIPGVVGSGPCVTFQEFSKHFHELCQILEDPIVVALSWQRLELLLLRFKIHKTLNQKAENKSNGDFYSCTKVDNHIHMAAGIPSQQLLSFITEKVRHHSHVPVVSDKEGNLQTLGEVFDELNIDVDLLTVRDLDVQADASLFQRFDNFNAKYNPLGRPKLREIFLKTSNFVEGRYFAEMVLGLFKNMKAAKYCFTELRLSIYGRSKSEWKELAQWYIRHDCKSPLNRWMIQVPRIYYIFHQQRMVKNFGEFLDNIFQPLWENTLNPKSDQYLALFLKDVVGFDSVDNEDVHDPPLLDIDPYHWDRPENPPYAYYMYYMWANIHRLNQARRERGLNQFAFRPHCGESGDSKHLAACFLVAQSINHGVGLRNTPSLQYLYYLQQIGLSVSPLSNNHLFLPYNLNPFPSFFKRGLNVTLSTDDPLQFHLTQEPLIEEYSIASKMWDLGMVDMCEVARNSVLQSGFEDYIKQKLLGKRYYLSSMEGNDPSCSHLASIRIGYRYDTMEEEVKYINSFLEKQDHIPNTFTDDYVMEQRKHLPQTTENRRESLFYTRSFNE